MLNMKSSMGEEPISVQSGLWLICANINIRIYFSKIDNKIKKRMQMELYFYDKI